VIELQSQELASEGGALSVGRAVPVDPPDADLPVPSGFPLDHRHWVRKIVT
jgi:hypothetical protein